MERGLNRNYLRNMILIRSNRSHEYSTTLGDTGQAQQGTSRDVQMALGPGHSTGSINAAIGSLTIQNSSMLCDPPYHPGNIRGKFYVVLVGGQVGVFREWETVRPLVVGFYGSRHKSFTTLSDAHEYWYEYCRTAHSHPAVVPPPYLSTDILRLRSLNTPPSSVPAYAPARQITLSSTALAALTNAGDSWELLGREGLEQAEQEVLRSA
ncbi:hypothetical protein BD779DRAFT_1473127 [Infundibulicybe gibba]|nr:hypothetical protein BD779DRAFT_1473127 [Infundibulicybe gibba]